MTTFNTRKTRSLLLVPVFAAFAIGAQGVYAAGADDTQTQVGSVLQGTHSQSGYSNYSPATSSAAHDVQEQARRVLLGQSSSAATASAVAGGGSNPGSSSSVSSSGTSRATADVLQLTQRVVRGI